VLVKERNILCDVWIIYLFLFIYYLFILLVSFLVLILMHFATFQCCADVFVLLLECLLLILLLASNVYI